MAKRWKYKDDEFLVEFHILGADFIASHDLGFKGKGAGEKRILALKEAGVWQSMKEARAARIKAQCAHTLAFSASEEAKDIARDCLEELRAETALEQADRLRVVRTIQ